MTPDVLARRAAAQRLLGRLVRFAHQADDQPMRVESVTFQGMVTVKEFCGCEFAPHVFVLVDDPGRAGEREVPIE